MSPPNIFSVLLSSTHAAVAALAEEVGQKPRELAEAIAAELANDPLVAKADVAGPGFINVTLKPAAWTGALRAVLNARNYGNVGTRRFCAEVLGVPHAG